MAINSSSSSSTSPPTPASKTPLPPGMVIGPDGKPCKICTAFRNWKPNTKQSSGSDSSGKGKGGFGGVTATMAALATGSVVAASSKTSTTTRPDEPPPNCPPDVEQLGRATWTFLHTTAAYYPDKPTTTQRDNMLALLKSLPVLYPCGWCAKDFGEDMGRNAPDVSSRVGLSRWLCERHNAVNVKLGKNKFDCARVDERWKDGPPDGSCD